MHGADASLALVALITIMGFTNPNSSVECIGSMLKGDEEMLFQKYERGDLIGEGAFGKVFIAEEKSTGKKVALKQIMKHRTHAAAFKKEVHILQFLHQLGGHPNVAGLQEVYEDKDNFYLVLELVAGGEVFEHLIQNGPYSEQTASRMLRCIVDALQFLHSHGLLHLDIKPENLMLSDNSPNAVVKLVDFGSAARCGTYSESAIGTRAYWPPETQIKDRVCLDYSIDMWGLGVVMFILLAGVHPFDTKGRLMDDEVSMSILLEKPAITKEFTGHLTQSAQDLLKRLLDKDPRKRPTAKELAEHPWIRGETATKEVIFGLDERLKCFRDLQRRLEAGIFTTLIDAAQSNRESRGSVLVTRRSREAALGHYVEPSSVEDASNLLGKVLKIFDPLNKGYISGDDFADVLLNMMGPGLDDKEAITLRGGIKAATGNHENRLGVIDVVELAKSYNLRTYKAGEHIFHQGDTADCMYFLNKGQVSISTTDKKGRSCYLTTFKAGEFFGESALLAERPQFSTAHCVTDVELLTISKEAFKRMNQDAPLAMASVRHVNRDRKLERIKRMMQVMTQIKNTHLEKGDYLFHEGTVAEHIYTILEGEFIVQKNDKEGALEAVAVRRAGSILGEMGFIHGVPHRHSVLCWSERCTVSAIRAHEMAALFSEYPHLAKVLEDLSSLRAFRAKIAHLLPEAERQWTLEELRKAFDEVSHQDASGHNFIRLEELRAVMDGLEGFVQTDEEVSLLMNLIDTDGDGNIGFEEFVRAMQEDV